MDQQKQKNSTAKEPLIVAFVLLSALLIMTDVGKNLVDEISITSELKTLSTKPVKTQTAIKQTLTEEELKAWEERLKRPYDI